MVRIRIKNTKGYEKDRNLVNTFSKDLKHFKPCFSGVTPTVVFAKVKKIITRVTLITIELLNSNKCVIDRWSMKHIQHTINQTWACRC